MGKALLYRGRRLRVNDAYDNILCIYQAYDDPDLTDIDRVEILLYRLIKGHRLYLRVIPDEWKLEIIEQAMKQYVDLPQRPVFRSTEKSLDFWKDKEYIYSSYQKDYGIDLIKEQGHLSWKRFIALFQGLSEKTKIREVMRIRTTKIPSYNGHNAEDIRDLQELKAYYALPVSGGGGQEGLNRLFAALKAQAM